ncbi:cytochrome c family protein [Thiohalobacter thiocyanaticus]|uniref:Cytochrome c n=1 Tax=Thiohalobacter thiocyanaticus TaxID=585455 RepID=A0A426QM39_9GAMM|nr:cytochrome c [Thiohalobacter thiocyanaticus]RRQ22777.1 cytochrome c [Thiohalobacter thiocyanaticus]
MAIRLTPLALSLGLLASAPVAAADIQAGKNLHDQHCMQCHDSGVYTREDRRVNSLAGLTKQVRRCEQSLGLKWFDEDIENVVQYLNQNHYHFE